MRPRPADTCGVYPAGRRLCACNTMLLGTNTNTSHEDAQAQEWRTVSSASRLPDAVSKGGACSLFTLGPSPGVLLRRAYTCVVNSLAVLIRAFSTGSRLARGAPRSIPQRPRPATTSYAGRIANESAPLELLSSHDPCSPGCCGHVIAQCPQTVAAN